MNEFNLAQFDYAISPCRIAQEPVLTRDSSRLLIVERKNKNITEGFFRDLIGCFGCGDVLVLNNTKVIKARLFGKKASGAKVEILLLKETATGLWEALIKPSRRIRLNDTIYFDNSHIKAVVQDKTPQGSRILRFSPSDIKSFLDSIGKVPLPPYIKKDVDDANKYQTIYAQKEGAVAAPTAGLHFTSELLSQFERKGVKIVYVTLHCSLATFRPVKTDDIRDHTMEAEWIEVSSHTAQIINNAKREGKRVVAVGTTSVRALESTAELSDASPPYIKEFSGQTDLYIIPGYKFKIVDALITNFHTPCSTNLILASAFCGAKLLMLSYQYALKNNFRFYSFGDAMLLV
ncbi:MAG: tRNA preQ1(34) S-adenosylmethionine ribosyltransferase-isomerase QueA [Candidatus Omnitrophota bacterium]|nr:MAG: tRNA preQ1(34) S-adenosylmethionine ribosyltransferase-isomerase QueA [Candidatus Omnitrophota bacterium]